jgi:hypothetical protein
MTQLAPLLVELGLTEALDVGAQSDEESVLQFTAIVQALVPRGSIAVIASGESDTLVELPDRQVWKYPRDQVADLADGTTAVTQIDSLRSEGAEWLLVPSSMFRWLDGCTGLETNLSAKFRRLFRIDGVGAAYDLRASPNCVSTRLPSQHANTQPTVQAVDTTCVLDAGETRVP